MFLCLSVGDEDLYLDECGLIFWGYECMVHGFNVDWLIFIEFKPVFFSSFWAFYYEVWTHFNSRRHEEPNHRSA